MFDCRHQPLRLPDPITAKLAAAYGESHRSYHGAKHVAEVLTWFDRVSEDIGWRKPVEVYLAIVFHDAIYQPGAKDNEGRSAQWAREAIERGEVGGPARIDLDRVVALIELTAWHGSVASVDPEAALFLDCDMAIVGSPPDVFAAYDQAIAREYAHLPKDVYTEGRRGFLKTLAARPRIFLSDYFHALLDQQARANLARALAA